MNSKRAHIELKEFEQRYTIYAQIWLKLMAHMWNKWSDNSTSTILDWVYRFRAVKEFYEF